VSRALAVALYVGYTPSGLWELYSFWGQCVLFGIVISVFLLQAVQQYNPQEACRMLAKEMKDHAVVVGYTHLGQRIVAPFVATLQEELMQRLDSVSIEDLCQRARHVGMDADAEASADFTI